MNARTWHVGTLGIRNFTADYGATIAVVITTAISYLVSISPITTHRLPDCPYSFQKGLFPLTVYVIHITRG
jgi:hypothetical protein